MKCRIYAAPAVKGLKDDSVCSVLKGGMHGSGLSKDFCRSPLNYKLYTCKKISYLSGISHLANLATCLLPEFGSLRDRLPSPASNPTCAGMSSVCGVYLPSLTIQSKSRA